MTDRQAGTATVELAVVLPVLLLLVFGLVQMLLLVNTKTVLDHAAYEAIRTAAVVGDHAGAEARFKRITAIIPGGPGFLAGKPKLRLRWEGDSIVAEVVAKIRLLPFFRQIVMIVSGDGVIEVRAGAKGKVEPYLGIKE